MLSVIEVTCPHCGAKGQIMLPPMGAIIVGPCPECQGLVVVFCGHILPLLNEIMLNGTIEEKREHLMTVITQFVKDRISQLVPDEQDEEAAAAASTEDSEDEFLGNVAAAVEDRPSAKPVKVTRPLISPAEVDSFMNVDLKLLDNRDYFKAVFG